MKITIVYYSLCLGLLAAISHLWQFIEQPLLALIMLGAIPGTNVQLSFNVIAPISLALLAACYWLSHRLYKQRIGGTTLNHFDLVAL